MSEARIRNLKRKYEGIGGQEWKIGGYKAFIHTNRQRLPLTDVHVQRLEHLIQAIPLQSLHRRASYEQILLCLAVFCIEETMNRTLPIENYKILKEYEITETMCRTILRNLLKHYRQNQPLQTTNQAHTRRNHTRENYNIK